MLAGSAGTIAALVNVTPNLHGELYKLFKEGKIEEAMALQAALGHGDWAISKLGGIAGVKAVVSRSFGYGSGSVRGPLKVVPEEGLKNNAYYNKLQTLIEEEKKL